MRCLCEVRRGGNLVDVNEDFPWEQPGTSSPHAHADKQAQKDVREVNGNTVGVGHASRRLKRVIESKEKQPNLWVRRVRGGVDAHAACGRRVFMSV